jgi:hypothetical protein
MDIETISGLAGTAVNIINVLYQNYLKGRETHKADKNKDIYKTMIETERIYGLMRELCFFYMSVTSRGTNIPSFPWRQEQLNRIKQLYHDLIDLKSKNKEIYQDPWFNIETEWRDEINSLIDDLNSKTPDFQTKPIN